MPTTIAKYTDRRQGFELCVVPMQLKRVTVEVFNSEIEIPSGRGFAIFLKREKAYSVMLIESPSAKREGVPHEVAKRLVYFINRQLNGVPKAPKREKHATLEEFKPEYDTFAQQWDESRTRVDGWVTIVGPMLATALAVLED